MANLATINNNLLADSGIDPLSVVTGSGTANQIAYWSSGSAIGSLTTATYPSLTELSYVKGVTSAIQTQLNAKQATLTLTTTGTSGAATLVGATLNIPIYQSVLTNPVTGTGTTNYVPKWTGSSAIGNSMIYDNGNTVQIGTTGITDRDFYVLGSATTSQSTFAVNGATKRYILSVLNTETLGALIDMRVYGTNYAETIFGQSMLNATAVISQSNSKFLIGNVSAKPIYFGTNDVTRLTIASDGTSTFANDAQVNGKLGASDNNGVFYRGISDSTWKTYYSTTTPIGLITEVNGDYLIRFYNAGTPATRFTFTTSGNLSTIGSVTIGNIPALTTASNAFVVSDSGTLKTRTAAQVLSDIGAQASLTNPVTGTGTATQVAFWSSSNGISSSSGFYWDNTNGRLAVGKNSANYRLEVYAGTKGQIAANGGTAMGAGIEFITELSGTDRRNWAIYTESTFAGDFEILRSTAAGGSATARSFSIDKTGQAYVYNLFSVVSSITSGIGIYLDNSGRASGKNWSLLSGNYANGTFSIKNETDSTTPFSIASSGRALLQGTAGYLFDVQETGANKTRFQVYVDSTMTALISGYDTTAKPMLFYTSGSAAMRIDTSGNLIINDTSAGGKLQITNNSGTAVRIDSAATYNAFSIGGAGKFIIDAPGISGGRFVVLDNGNVGINYASPTTKLYVAGTSTFTDEAYFTDKVGVGTVSLTYKLEASGALGNYWNGSSFTGTPLAIAISNTQPGGYDSVLLYRQTDSGGTTKLSGGIGLVGTGPWTAGNNASQASDMYFLVRNSSGGISERVRITSGGSLVVGASSSSYLFHVNGTSFFNSYAYFDGGYLNQGRAAEKILSTGYFTDGVANQAVDLYFGNVAFWGQIEVSIASDYSYQNASGVLTKLFGIGVNPGGSIYTNESRVTESMGQTPNNIAIGDFGWDSTNSRYKITISHIVSTGNSFRIRIRFFDQNGNTFTYFNNAAVTSPYTLTALSRQYVYYNDRVGINTTSPTDKLHVLGADDGITISSISANRPVLKLINGSTTMLKLSANGTYAAIADNSGNDIIFLKNNCVGIGTDTTSGNRFWVKGTSTSSGDTAIYAQNSAGASLLTVRNDGNVGIGSASPASLLDVYGGLYGSLITSRLLDNGNYTDSPGGGLGLGGKYTSGGSVTEFGIIRGIKENTTDNNFAGYLSFLTRPNGGSWAERIRINSSGQISINTPTAATNIRMYMDTSGSNISSGTADSTTNMRGVMLNVTENSTESIGLWFRTGGNHLSGISGQRSGAVGTVDGWATDLRFYTHPVSTTNLSQTFERMRISSEGEVWIGYTSDQGAYLLQVNGTIYASGDVIAYSDISVKNNIRPIKNVLSRITESRGVLYDRIDNGDKNNIGFIAQELEQQFPELIQTNKDGTKGVKYQNAVAVLFEAIKEQQKQIDELKNKN